MHCVDHPSRARPRRWTGILAACLMGLAAFMPGCAWGPRPAGDGDSSATGVTPLGKAARDAGAPVVNDKGKLEAPGNPRNWIEARAQAARRLVAANPDITYMGTPPDILLAIPVLTIDLHADGSIRRIEVMRYPGQARDTVDIAIKAVRRAAPFGNVSRLPKPWRFNETFLFNNERKFKPMTLDQP